MCCINNHLVKAVQPYSQAYYVTLFYKGDERGLSYVFHTLWPAMIFFANQWVKNNPLAEEIASGAFVKLWKMHYKLDSFSGIRAYLYKIVARDCKRALQTAKKQGSTLWELTTDECSAESAFDKLVKSETYRWLHDSIKKLSAGSYTVIEMYYLQEKSVAEIATELGLSINTINSQKRRGIAALKRLLAGPALSFLI